MDAIQLPLYQVRQLDKVRSSPSEDSASFSPIQSVVKVWSLKESPKIGLTCQGEHYFRLSFRKGGRDQAMHSLHQALTSRQWITAPLPPPLSSEGPPKELKAEEAIQVPPEAPVDAGMVPDTEKQQFSTRNAGVGGILRKKAEQAQSNDAALQEAFQDIDALMKQAKEMVDLSKTLSRMTSDQDSDLRQFMMSMGIDNPVTK